MVQPLRRALTRPAAAAAAESAVRVSDESVPAATSVAAPVGASGPGARAHGAVDAVAPTAPGAGAAGAAAAAGASDGLGAASGRPGPGTAARAGSRAERSRWPVAELLLGTGLLVAGVAVVGAELATAALAGAPPVPRS